MLIKKERRLVKNQIICKYMKVSKVEKAIHCAVLAVTEKRLVLEVGNKLHVNEFLKSISTTM